MRTATKTTEHHDKNTDNDDDDKTSARTERGSDGARFSLAHSSTQLNIILAVVIIAVLYFARAVILPIVLAYVGALVLKPSVLWFARWRIPRALSTLLILGVFFGVVGFGFVELSQPAMKWVNDAPHNFQQLRERLEKVIPTQKFQKAMDAATVMDTPKDQSGKPPPTPVEVQEHKSAGEAVTWTSGLLGGLVETVVLLYMFLVVGDDYMDQILDGANSAAEKHRILKISQEIQKTISGYLATVSLINLCLGIGVGVGLYVIGTPNAALWGLLAMLLNFIPYFGPIIGIIIVGLVSILSDGSWVKEFMPAAWYLLLHVAEADFITPVLLGRKFTISPLVVFVTLLFWMWLWGPLGALLAVPILMCLKVIFQGVPRLAPVARFL